jgi:anti-sigma B factor antagonist
MDGDRHVADAVRSVAVVPMPAEIDIANATRLAVELDASIKPGVKTLVIDMTHTTFCDSLGVRVIARTRRRAEAEGVDLRLVADRPQVLRILAATGLDVTVPVYPQLGHALCANSNLGPKPAGTPRES